VNLWNSLPNEAVEATSLNVFKTQIDKCLNRKGVMGYGERAGKWELNPHDQISHDLIEWRSRLEGARWPYSCSTISCVSYREFAK